MLTKAAEKITGRNCVNCRFNRGGHCAHPQEAMFLKCWNSITKPGHAGKYERTVFTLKVTASEWEGVLSEEEQHQLQRIKASLQEAADMAKESGLVGTNAKKPIFYDRDKEEYFRREFRCPECATYLAAYNYGRASTDNGLREEYRAQKCNHCGQEIDWSGVPYPDKNTEG
jgi:hypothetical protein